MSYYSLHCHDDTSNFFLRDSTNKISELIQTAFDIGLKGLAITNHDRITSHVKAENYIEKQRANEALSNEEKEKWKHFKLIRGNEIYLCRNGLSADNFQGGVDKFYHFILIALDEVGHKQIRELSTRAYLRSFMRSRIRRVPTYYSDLEDIVKKNPGHIIGTTACLGSFVDQKLLLYRKGQFELDKIVSWIKYIQNIFGKENFYLELQPSYSDEQTYVNQELLKLSKRFCIPAIITTDAHYLRKQDASFHSEFLKAQNGDREVDSFYATTYLMTTEEIHEYMDEAIGKEKINELLSNTEKIGERAMEYTLKKPIKIPCMLRNREILSVLPSPFDQIEIFQRFFLSEYLGDRVLIKRIIDVLISKPEFLKEDVLEKTAYELKILWNVSNKDCRWSLYLANVQEFVDIIWENSIMSPGRGSVCGEFIAYLLGISQANPMIEDVPTLSERFLNDVRASVVDIDLDSASDKREIIIKRFKEIYGELRVSKVVTIGTETSRSSIITSARALNIDNDKALYWASMIESDRGKQRTLEQTYYGDVKDDFPPNKTFVEEMNKHPEVWDLAQKTQGLAVKAGSHAGGIIFVDEDFTETSSLMVINSGDIVSAFDLEDEELCGHIKIDCLSTNILARTQKCLELLIEAGFIEKKPTLRETYESTIGVYNLERNAPEMWKLIAENKVISLFQFDTTQGQLAISLAKPSSVAELAALNSIMRLMPSEKGAELPLDKFARFKKDGTLWDKEMDSYGLTQKEKELLHSYLDYEHGIMAAQEDILLLVQREELGGLGLAFGEKLRKCISKKKPDEFIALENIFYDNVKVKNISQKFARYFWEILVKTQRGYSFNNAHTLVYSLVGLQNMNLAYRFPIIFWNTANLIVDSEGFEDSFEILEDGAIIEKEEDEIEENYDEFQEEDEAEEEQNEFEDALGEEVFGNSNDLEIKEKKKKTLKTVRYDKISSAIGKFRQRGITILPPNINVSGFTFTPDEKANKITYGLRGITGIPSSLAKTIIERKPYNNVLDFTEKVKITRVQMMNLIKAGAFDDLEGKSREQIFREYLLSTLTLKKDIGLANMGVLISMKLLPEQLKREIKLYNFNKFLKSCLDEKGEKYCLTDKAISYIMEECEPDLLEDNLFILKKIWEKYYTKNIKPLKDYFKEHKEDLLEKINSAMVDDLMEKYGTGTISKWEMESIGFYYHDHELQRMQKNLYDVSNFFELSEVPKVAKTFISKKDGAEIVLFRLYNIVGTVIGKNKMKNTVSLLTPDGVVTLKVWKTQFVKYDRRISKVDAKGTKKVLEESWFKRGNLLMVQGIRRGQDFIPKAYKDSSFQTPIMKITQVFPNGSIKWLDDRIETE